MPESCAQERCRNASARDVNRWEGASGGSERLVEVTQLLRNQLRNEFDIQCNGGSSHATKLMSWEECKRTKKGVLIPCLAGAGTCLCSHKKPREYPASLF